MANAATAAPVIGFRPMASADMDMMADWLARPHWSEWWGDPVEELANTRAVRAYTKAGFRPVPELLNRTGDSLIMRHCKD